MNIAFFGYNWEGKIGLNAYMNEIVASFSNLGFNIDVYLGNKLAIDFGIFGVRESISIDSVAKFIAKKKYLFAVSFNNSMLTPEIINALNGSIVSVIVDELEHLFNHNYLSLYDPFNYEIDFVVMSSSLQKNILKKIPSAEKRIHLLPPATNITSTEKKEKMNSNLLFEISWIASLLTPKYTNQKQSIYDFFNLAADSSDIYTITQNMLKEIETNRNLENLDNKSIAVISEFININLGWPLHVLEFELKNIITNRNRIDIVELLQPLGLKLYGNNSWRSLLITNKKVFSCLQPGCFLENHKSLLEIYNRSRISINSPQHHVAPEAIQFRVLDIMSSKSLLITKANIKSDLYLFFGKNCPVPTFSTNIELKKLCVHFLKNEVEREAIVDECNKLITEEFTFKQQCKKIISILKLNYLHKENSDYFCSAKGEINYMDLNLISR